MALGIRLPMKYVLATVSCCLLFISSIAQENPVSGFLNGKSAVLISASPSAQPLLPWKKIAEELHPSLIEAGGDPVAYYELEDVVLSEENQNVYAEAFKKRLIENIVVITRKADGGFHLHLSPFTNDGNILRTGQGISTEASDLADFKSSISTLGRNLTSQNFLVLEIPEFPIPPTGGGTGTSANYIPRAPLNLDVFKLGVMLTGSSGESGLLTTFRHDLLGKSPEQRMAEQQAEKEGLEAVFKEAYPYDVEFVTEALTNQQLIQNRVQFILMRMEGREADIMKSMGVPLPEEADANRIVVKYYIKFLVRNEQYIGSTWDASPDWREALYGFLSQLGP